MTDLKCIGLKDNVKSIHPSSLIQLTLVCLLVLLAADVKELSLLQPFKNLIITTDVFDIDPEMSTPGSILTFKYSLTIKCSDLRQEQLVRSK